jgi:hypothetical protein
LERAQHAGGSSMARPTDYGMSGRTIACAHIRIRQAIHHRRVELGGNGFRHSRSDSLGR